MQGLQLGIDFTLSMANRAIAISLPKAKADGVIK
jgi:hypothetical protein